MRNRRARSLRVLLVGCLIFAAGALAGCGGDAKDQKFGHVGGVIGGEGRASKNKAPGAPARQVDLERPLASDAPPPPPRRSGDKDSAKDKDSGGKDRLFDKDKDKDARA